MKISLTYPRETDAPMPPLGILYIAAVLEKEGYKLKIFDVSSGETAFIEDLTKIRSEPQNKFVFRNYISNLRSPIYVLNFLLLIIKCPKGLLKGFKKAIKLKRFDDIIYSLLEEYRLKRKSEIVSKK